MKRNLLLLLCLVLALAPVACAETETGTASSQKASSAAVSSQMATASSGAPAASEEASSVDASSAGVSSEPELGPYDARTYQIADATDKFHVTGRTMPIAACGQTGMLFDHAAQGLHFTADCEGDVTLDIALYSSGKTPENVDHQLFTVMVDGVRTDMELSSGTPEAIRTVTLAKGLSRGKHTFDFYKGNEASLGRATVVSVSVNGTVETYTAPAGQLKIIFFGDSITAGHGTRTTSGAPGQEQNRYRDATLTYAFRCAELLNADFSCIARSGLQTFTSPADLQKDPSKNASEYYKYTSIVRPDKVEYDASKEDVDVYVISLGTNDSFSSAKVKPYVVALLQTVRADHPNAKIVWAYGQMTTARNDAYSGAVEELGGAAAGFYYFQFSQTNRDGGASHPSAEAHAKFGAELADFIRTIV